MNWHQVDLATVIDTIESGSRPKGGASVDSGEVASLGGENILQSGGVTIRDVKRVPITFFESMTKGHLQKSDVLINKDGANTGKVGIYRPQDADSACINEHLFLLRGDSGQITQEYLYYTLLSEYGQTTIRNRISGSAQPGLKAGFIQQFPVNLPYSIEEQTKIATILSTLDQAIKNTEAIVAKQLRIKTGLIQDLLTKGINEQGVIRSEATHKFKDSSLGRIPVGWEVKSLDSCVHSNSPICYGILMPGSGFDNGVPVIKVKDIFDGSICQEDILLTDPKIDREYKRSRLNKDDILMTIRGTTGRVAIVPKDLDGSNITQDTARIRLKPEYSNVYFYFLLQSWRIQDQVMLHTLGQAVKGINIAEVRRISLAVPEKAEQDRISAILDNANKLWEVAMGNLSKLHRQKSGLMSDLLTGKVRVKY